MASIYRLAMGPATGLIRKGRTVNADSRAPRSEAANPVRILFVSVYLQACGTAPWLVGRDKDGRSRMWPVR